MQQLAATNSYFNILAPPIAGHLSTPAYDGLFQASKVIYPGYAENFRVSDLQTLVGDTFLQRWSIHLQKRDFYLSIDTDQGIVPIHDGTPDLPDYTLLDFLNWFYPTWKTHQHLNAFTARPQQSLCITPHPDSHDIAFTVQVRVTPCGHPFFSTSSRWANRSRYIQAEILDSLRKKGNTSTQDCLIFTFRYIDSITHWFILAPLLHWDTCFPRDVAPARSLVFRILNANSASRHGNHSCSPWWSFISFLYSSHGPNDSNVLDRSYDPFQEGELPNDNSTRWIVDRWNRQQRSRNLETYRDLSGDLRIDPWPSHHSKFCQQPSSTTSSSFASTSDHFIADNSPCSTSSWTSWRTFHRTIFSYSRPHHYFTSVLGKISLPSFSRIYYIPILAPMEKYTGVYTNSLFYDAYGHGIPTYTIPNSCWTCPRPSLSGWSHSPLWRNGHFGHERLKRLDKKNNLHCLIAFMSQHLSFYHFFILISLPYMPASPVILLQVHLDRCSTYLMRHGSPTTPRSSLYGNFYSTYGDWISDYTMVWIWPRVSRRTTWPSLFDAK